MRTRIGELPRAVRQDGLGEVVVWWSDCPWSRSETWASLLFEKGQGWLRWGMDTRTTAGVWDHNACAREPGWDYPVAPPLRRAARWLWGQVVAPLYARRTGESWSIARSACTDVSWLKDEERGWEWRRG